MLAARAQSVRGPYRDRLRAAIVLAAATGRANAAIAAELGACTDTVRKWRRRFAEGRLAGLKDAPCSGRPWRPQSAGGWPATPSSPGSTGRGSLSVIVSSPPGPGGCSTCTPGSGTARPLGPGDYVICADEKTSIQARCRCHPTLPPGKARAMRIEHDYDRDGALAYLAAWDVRRGQVTGRCEDTTGIAPFARLAEQVMTTEPYASAGRVFWIVDNGSSHRGAASAERMATAWPNAQLIHLPAHASWLDQAEIYLLRRPAQSPYPQRLHRPRPDPRPPRRVRDPLQRHRPAVHLEVHPHRPRRPATPDRRPRQDPRPGSPTTMDPDELTGQTT